MSDLNGVFGMGRHGVILGMGGTIAGAAPTADDALSYQAGALPLETLVASVPPLATRPLAFETVAALDSKDIGPSAWGTLLTRVAHHLNQDSVAGVVITHGTDTLEETAFVLQHVLRPAKPVVLTCAMRPATALSADGPQNLLDAVDLALNADARGVLVACAGRVHHPDAVIKIHTTQTDAFSSGDEGPLALMIHGKLKVLRPWPETVEAASVMDHVRWATANETLPWPRVEVVFSHAGTDGSTVRALLADPMPSSPLRGLIVAGTGNGTLHHSLESALQDAHAHGVVVRRTSRCPLGHVHSSGRDAFPAIQLPWSKARLALALELAGVI